MRKRGKRFSTKRDPNSLVKALVGVHTIDKEQQLDLELAYRLAFQSLRSGNGQEDDFHTIACSLNIALVMAERWNRSWLEPIKKAQDGLMRCLERSSRLGKWGLDGEAMTAISEALAVHDLQLKITTQHEIKLCIAEVHKRVRSGQVMGFSA